MRGVHDDMGMYTDICRSHLLPPCGVQGVNLGHQAPQQSSPRIAIPGSLIFKGLTFPFPPLTSLSVPIHELTVHLLPGRIGDWHFAWPHAVYSHLCFFPHPCLHWTVFREKPRKPRFSYGPVAYCPLISKLALS